MLMPNVEFFFGLIPQIENEYAYQIMKQTKKDMYYYAFKY